MSKEGVLGKSIKSGKWLSIGYVIQRTLGIASFVVLDRILSPEDFGVMAVVLIVPNFLQATTEMGFYPAIIQSEGSFKKYLDPIWTIGIIKSIIILIVTFFGAPIIADFLNAEHIESAIKLGGIFSFILRLGNPAEVTTYRNVEFKNVFVRDTVREITYITIAIISAILLKSYWALIIATFASKIAQVTITYIQYSYRPHFSFHWKKLKELFGYSKWIIGQGWLNQIYSATESMTITRLSGIYNMGLYTKGKNLASVGPGFISSIMNQVSFSAYSRLKDSLDKINDGFKKSLDILFFFVVPVGFLLLTAGGKLILIFLGEKWLPMNGTMQIMFIYFSLNLILEILYALFNGVGHPQKKVKMDMIKIVLTLSMIIPFTKMYGIIGAALALLFGMLPVLLIALIHLKKITKISYKEIFKTTYSPATLSIFMMMPIIIFKDSFLSWNTSMLLLYGAFSGIFYLGGTYIMGKKLNTGPYKTIETILKHVL